VQFSLIFLSLSLSLFLSLALPPLLSQFSPDVDLRASAQREDRLFFLFSVRPYLFYFSFRQVAINLHFTPGRWDRFVKHYPRRGAAYGRVHERLLRRRLRDYWRNTRRNAGAHRWRFCGDEIIRRRFTSCGLWILNPHHGTADARSLRIIRCTRARRRMDCIHVGRTGVFRKRSCSRDRNAPERLYRSHFRHADAESVGSTHWEESCRMRTGHLNHTSSIYFTLYYLIFI